MTWTSQRSLRVDLHRMASENVDHASAHARADKHVTLALSTCSIRALYMSGNCSEPAASDCESVQRALITATLLFLVDSSLKSEAFQSHALDFPFFRMPSLRGISGAPVSHGSPRLPVICLLLSVTKS